jgi:ligand-binding SRPBCC domain-containing protein
MITIKTHSGVYTLTTQQELPVSLKEAWPFFCSPKNLAKITPAYMGFKMTSDLLDSMYEGQIITYRIGLFPGIRSNWVTEIKHISFEKFFIDEQRVGPYKLWYHEHHFKETAHGIVMTDKVTYQLPLGVLGRLIHPLVIKPQLIKIFSFRREALKTIFGSVVKLG